jgi:cell wall-associated NlpC family hydrolase
MNLIEAVRSYLGTPWRHQGDSRAGMDCAGLLIAAARDCGIAVAPVVRTPLPELELFDVLPRYCDRISVPEPGAVLRMRVAGRPQHLAVAAAHPDGGLSIVHADMRHGVCEHRLDDRWTRRVVSCWRLREA